MGEALYNELEPYAAQWLRNLIAAGHVAPGVVDDRSIVDLRPDDVAGPGQRHFFAGIGVWSYALRLAGVPDDASIWTASCPCQPFSSAGQRRGFADERHLWPILRGLIAECRPTILLGEQVASGDGRTWFAAVRADLEALGYAVGAADLCAAGVGAPHIRQRLYFVAYADEAGRGEQRRTWLRADGDASQRHDVDGRSTNGALADDASNRWLERIDEREGQGDRPRPADDRRAVALAYASGDERGSRRTGRAHGDRAIKSARRSDASRLGDPGSARGWRDAGADARAEAASSGERSLARGVGDEPIAASADDPWADCEWVPCSDGKSRPVEPGTLKMVDGDPAGMGCLRSQEEEVSDALSPLRIGSDEEEIWEEAGGLLGVQPPRVLQSGVHGSVDGGSHEGVERQERSPSVIKDGGTDVQSVRSIGFQVDGSSSRREPAEQRCGKPRDVVRLLSRSFALAKLHGDDRTAAALLALLSSVGATRLVLDPPHAQEAAWRSLSEEVQARIVLGLEAFAVIHSFPLAHGVAGRVGRLRAYGNAIVAQQAATFVRAAIGAIAEAA